MQRRLLFISLLAFGSLCADAPQPEVKKPDAWPIFDPNSLKHSHRVWIDAEALFWQSNMGSLDYGTTSDSTTSITNGHVKSPNFKWDWGARIGIGYKIPHDKWEVLGTYTYVHGNGSGHAGGTYGVVYPTWANPVGFAGSGLFYSNSATAHWSMHLNMGDIELGRTCMVGKWLTIRPFMGVRGLVIDENYRVTYSGGSAFPSSSGTVNMGTDFWGVGLRFGFDTLWGLGKGIGIYGNGSASLLSGNFDIKEVETLSSGSTVMNIVRDFNNVVAAADLALGLQWDYMFSKDRFHFGVKFGYEFNIFFDQNQLFNFLSTSVPGAINFQNDDLTFQGVTLGFRFDF